MRDKPDADGWPRGRGAPGNPACRYHAARPEAVDDGWRSDEAEPASVKTSVAVDATRTVLARNQSPDVPFEVSINPYRGCEHGCIYCYARPSHAYLGLSPGLDFESRLQAKPAAAELLRKELATRGYRCRPIALGTNTDPYQPVEREWRITRALLELLNECRHPVSVVTKSALIERDLDVLAAMAAAGLAEVMVSITTLDRRLARRMEPRAAAPQRRLDTIARLAAAGVPVGVLVAPVIPVLTDAELEAVLTAAADAGARSAGYVLLRLPQEVGALFEEWLARHYPQAARHVMSRLRQARGGRHADARFGTRMTGEGDYANLLARRFALACRRSALDRPQPTLDTGQFQAPPSHGEQLRLL